MLRAFTESLKAAGLDIHGAELFYKGQAYRTGRCDVRLPIYSVTKSITSAAFMLACDDGLLSPELPLSQFLESKYHPLMSEDFKQLPFSRFMTMTAGRYPFRPEGDDWTRSILSLDTDYTDTAFHYSNIPAYLVGAAVENVYGGELLSVLDKRIFSPLSIPAPPCQTSPEGHFYGATGMELSVSELATLGRLFLSCTEPDGTRLISQEAVKRAVSPLVDTGRGDSYGYFFRTDKLGFYMRGKWGQQCIICPEKQLVLAYLSHQPERADELHAAAKAFVSQI